MPESDSMQLSGTTTSPPRKHSLLLPPPPSPPPTEPSAFLSVSRGELVRRARMSARIASDSASSCCSRRRERSRESERKPTSSCSRCWRCCSSANASPACRTLRSSCTLSTESRCFSFDSVMTRALHRRASASSSAADARPRSSWAWSKSFDDDMWRRASFNR